MRQHVQGVASQRLSDKFERPHAREQDSSQRQARPEKEARSRVFKMLILKTRVPFSLVSCLRGPGHKRTTDSVFGLSVACFRTDPSFLAPLFLGARHLPFLGRPPNVPFWSPPHAPTFLGSFTPHATAGGRTCPSCTHGRRLLARRNTRNQESASPAIRAYPVFKERSEQDVDT
jgi:hypothetical protein